jgi:hypothetical protein
MQVAGVVLGLALAGVGTFAVLDKPNLQPRDALILLGFLGLGFLFIRFGITGKRTLPALPGVALLAIGILFLVVGAYTVFFDPTASFTAKVTSSIVAVLGGGSLIVAAMLKGRLR